MMPGDDSLSAGGTGENHAGQEQANAPGWPPRALASCQPGDRAQADSPNARAALNPGSRQGSGREDEKTASQDTAGRAQDVGLAGKRVRSLKAVASLRPQGDPLAGEIHDGPEIDSELLHSLLDKYSGSATLADESSIKNVYSTFMFQLGEQEKADNFPRTNSNPEDETMNKSRLSLGRSRSNSRENGMNSGMNSMLRTDGAVVGPVRAGHLRHKGIEDLVGYYGLNEEKPEELAKRIYQISVAQAKERGQPAPKRTDAPSLDFEGVLMIIEDIASGRKVKISKPLIPIDPDKMPKQVWDCFIMTLLFYTCFAVPYLLAFDTPAPNLMDVPYNVFDVTLDIIFMLDMGVSFVTAYYVEGVFVNKIRLIAINYLKTWFFLDLAGSFPFDKVILSVAGPTVDLASLRILKAVRMLKLIRAVKFIDHLNRLQEKPGFGAFKANLQIFKCVFMLVFVSHLLGCIFTMLIDKEGPNWLETYDPNLVDAPNEERYLVALYYAVISLSTMGYGDVLPITTSEKVFGVFIAIVGAIVFSYCMGTITSLITQIIGADAKFDMLLTAMDEWLDYRNVPQKTRMMVRRHMYGVVRKGPTLFGEFDNLELLTPHLRSLVMTEIAEAGDSKMTLNLFKGLSVEEKGAIMICMESERYAKDEVIYNKGERGDRLCGIISGTVKMYRSTTPVVQKGKLTHIEEEEQDQNGVEDDRTTISQGHTFGELCLFENLARHRTETVVCTSDVHLMTLSRASLERLHKVHPLLATRIRKYCELLALQQGVQAVHSEGKHVSKVRESALDMALSSVFEAVVAKNVNTLSLEASEFAFTAWRPREDSGCVDDAYHSSILEETPEKKALVKDVLVIRKDGEVLVWEGTLQGLQAACPTSLGHLSNEVYQESVEELEVTQTGKPFVMTKKVFEFRLLLSQRSAGAQTNREIRVFVHKKHLQETRSKLMQFKDTVHPGMGECSPQGLICPTDVSILAEDFAGGDIGMSAIAPRRKLDVSLDMQRSAELEAQMQELRERMSGMDKKMDSILSILSFTWATA